MRCRGSRAPFEVGAPIDKPVGRKERRVAPPVLEDFCEQGGALGQGSPRRRRPCPEGYRPVKREATVCDVSLEFARNLVKRIPSRASREMTGEVSLEYP